MIKIVTKDTNVYFPIGQIKMMAYDRDKRIVKVILIDDTETEYEEALKVYLNGEEI